MIGIAIGVTLAVIVLVLVAVVLIRRHRRYLLQRPPKFTTTQTDEISMQGSVRDPGFPFSFNPSPTSGVAPPPPAPRHTSASSSLMIDNPGFGTLLQETSLDSDSVIKGPLDRKLITLKNIVGKGNFGSVHRASLMVRGRGEQGRINCYRLLSIIILCLLFIECRALPSVNYCTEAGGWRRDRCGCQNPS